MAWYAQKDARSLAWALRMNEGTGPFAPTGVLCSHDIDLEVLRRELRSVAAHLPYKPPSPIVQQQIEERVQLAKKRGRHFEEEGIVVLPPSQFLPYAAPQIVTLYPVENPQEAFDMLLPYRGWLNFLGSDDIQYPYEALDPDIELLRLQNLFRGVLSLAQLPIPPLEMWKEA